MENIYCVHDVMDREPAKEYTLFKLSASEHSYPFHVAINVNGQDLAMKIDTGASLSLISEVTVAKQAITNQYSQPNNFLW